MHISCSYASSHVACSLPKMRASAPSLSACSILSRLRAFLRLCFITRCAFPHFLLHKYSHTRVLILVSITSSSKQRCLKSLSRHVQSMTNFPHVFPQQYPAQILCRYLAQNLELSRWLCTNSVLNFF